MQVYAAPKELVSPSIDIAVKEGTQAYLTASEAYVESVQKWARENATPHKLNGEIVRRPFADGYAEYVVAKIGARVSLIHLDVMDGWRDGYFEDTATVKILTEMVERGKKLAAIFGG